MLSVSSSCAQCNEKTRASRREFSEQAWAVLLVWNEIDRSTVDQPICDECYNDLREVLIDRATEVEMTLKNPEKFKRQASSAPAATKKTAGKRTAKAS